MSNIHDDVMSDIKALRAANKAEIAKRDEVIKGLVFAYQNKDPDCPHDFETEALKQADAILEGEG